MKPVWSAVAVRHLREVVEFFQSENARGTVSLRRRILETAERIGQMPYSGSVGRIKGTREVVAPRSPFIVVYQVSGQRVEIVGIWYGTGRMAVS
jgi:plasmid stabilization system protein ParE